MSIPFFIENFLWSDRSINYLSGLLKSEDQLLKEKPPRLTSALSCEV